MSGIKVVEWVSWEEAADLPESPIGGMGGWVSGHKWGDDAAEFTEAASAHAEAFREAIIEGGIREGGDWHQQDAEGVPKFSDGTVATFSYRGWGDMLALIWGAHDNKPYSYMDFYMSDW